MKKTIEYIVGHRIEQILQNNNLSLNRKSSLILKILTKYKIDSSHHHYLSGTMSVEDFKAITLRDIELNIYESLRVIKYDLPISVFSDYISMYARIKEYEIINKLI